MHIVENAELAEVSRGEAVANVHSNWQIFEEGYTYVGRGLGNYTAGTLLGPNHWVVVSGLASCAALILIKGDNFFAAHLGGDENALKHAFKDPIQEWAAQHNSPHLDMHAFGCSPNKDRGLAEKWGRRVLKYSGTVSDRITFYLGLNRIAVNKNLEVAIFNKKEAMKPPSGQAIARRKCCVLM